jgi:hypothetical protein
MALKAGESRVVGHEVRAQLLEPQDFDHELIEGHAWQLPIRRYGSSVIARCSCGWTSHFHLTAERLLGSRCERQELEIASRARAAMVGW